MNYQIDEILFIDENHIRIFFADRPYFDVVTNHGMALALTVELLQPYFEGKKLKTEQQKQAA